MLEVLIYKKYKLVILCKISYRMEKLTKKLEYAILSYCMALDHCIYNNFSPLYKNQQGGNNYE